MGERKNFVSATYAGSLDDLTTALKGRRVTLKERHVLIVPDIYTFTLEKRLFSEGKGAFDLEVTTFNRLYARAYAGREVRPLSKQGALMLIRRICRKNASALKFYGSSCLKAGFAAKLYDTLNKLRACAVTPEALSSAAKGVLKAEDIAFLYAEYMRETAGRYVDAAGRSDLLAQAVENEGLLSSAHVYVALYDRFSERVKMLLDVIEKNSLSLSVFSSAGETRGKIGETEIYKVNDIAEGYKRAAAGIRAFVRSGEGKYGDVCLVCGGGDEAVAARIMDEYKVPYYLRRAITLSGTELAAFLFGCLSAAAKKYRTADMLALCGNYYLGADKSDSDCFRRYVTVRAVDYLGFMRPFEKSALVDEETAAAAERVRSRLVGLIRPLEGVLGAEDLKERLEELLIRVNAKEKTDALAALDGRALSPIYDKAREMIALLAEICGGEKLNADVLIETLREGFDGTAISLVPNAADTVQIGPLAQFRGTRPPLAVIVGFEEGRIPSLAEDDGLLSDDDSAALDEYKVRYAPLTAETNALTRGELWQLLTSAGKLIITYSDGGDKRPSFDLKLLKSRYRMEDTPVADLGDLDLQGLMRTLGSESGAMENLLLNRDSAAAPLLAAALGEKYSPYLYPEKKSDFLPAGGIPYFSSGFTSVSAIQTYFDCPYKFFMRYGLGVEKVDDGTVKAPDIGLLLHEVVEKFVRAGLPKDVAAFVRAAATEAAEKYEKYALESSGRLLARLTDEATKLCGIVAEQLAAGKFVPLGAEQSFGRQDSPLHTLTLSSGVKFTGSIDRVDVYDGRARVIDYKSGSTSFSYNDMYFGRKIQLPIYMRVLEQNGYRPGGMFYFPFAVEWSDDEYSHVLSGVYDCSGEMLSAYDRALDGPAKSRVINANIKQFKSGPRLTTKSFAMTEEELKGLSSYAEKVVERAVDEMKQGYFAPSPAATRHSVCSYCDYFPVCGGRPGRNCNGAGRGDILAAAGVVSAAETESEVQAERDGE